MSPTAPARVSATPADTLRLFVGLWPDAAARRALQAAAERWQWPPGARRVAPARMHVTLHFLGPVPRARRAELEAALAAPAAVLEPFELRLGRASLWPHGLAALEPPTDATGLPALHALHAHLAEVLRNLDLAVEARRYRPHLTLAREAPGAVPPAEPPDIGWTVRGYALVHSEQGYRTLRAYP